MVNMGEHVPAIVTCLITPLELAFLCFLILATYRMFFHPLARIPGPKLAIFSNVWQAIHVRNGLARELAKSLHKKYGPVVRIGPNEVWFDSIDAFKTIYSNYPYIDPIFLPYSFDLTTVDASNGYEKSEFYLATALTKPSIDWRLNVRFPDTLDLLSEFDMKRYRLQRRLMGPLYMTANIKKFEPAVDSVIKRAVSELCAVDGAEVDLKEWMHIIAVECLGAVVLSWSPGYIKNRSDGGTSTQSYLGWKRKSVFGLFPAVTTLAFFSKSLSRAFSNIWNVTYRTPKNFKPFFTPVYQKTSKRITNAIGNNPRVKGENDARRDLLADLIQRHKQRPEFTKTYLRRLAITNFGAGHETLCATLTSVLAMIGTHPAVHATVAEETRKLPGGQISYDEAICLRYAQACIKEAQRLYPVIGMSLSRKVPAGGVSLHGYYFPAGTVVGCNPVSLHRNTEIFGSDASQYNPGRWLDEENPGRVRVMERNNLIWGGVPRACPGRYLAELIVFKVVPALLREFDIEITNFPPEEEMPHYFMSMLTGVKVKFQPVGGGGKG